MADFTYLDNNSLFLEAYKTCQKAENAEKFDEKAAFCRDALIELFKVIYSTRKADYSNSATLVEIINGPVISSFVPDESMLKALHFIRKVGNNVQHGIPIKKKEAILSYSNLKEFASYTFDRIQNPNKPFKKFSFGQFSEAQTRKVYIDLYLEEAGWKVVEPQGTTSLKDGTVVKSGSPIAGCACCEIPVTGMNNASGVGFCDYVLYGRDGKPLAIVEAKSIQHEALVGQKQVKEYGECMRKQYGYVPVLYYTNGYEIYIIDGIYPARKLTAFHTLEDLEYMMQKRNRVAMSDLKIRDDITGRPYQKMAITKVCERFNSNYRRSLLVMATGTGKTRVSISIVELMMRNRWIKSVLFLADRTSLVDQAFRNFKKLLPDLTYCVYSDLSKADDDNAMMCFSTHQTMINFIDAEEKKLSIGRFDLIIIDEAHRSIFKKYGTIFDYFDSLLVGLTATPRSEVDASTYQVFDCENDEPDFAYALDDAVKDGYLVPYKVESRTTKLLSTGVKYADLSEDDKEKVEMSYAVELDGEDIPTDFIFPKEELFSRLYNVDTCGRVLEDLMNNGIMVDDGQLLGKTIIFAYNHQHAELIVDTFRKNYPHLAKNDDYCQLIDNRVKNAKQLILDFESKPDFRIAVSVDMLDTGIDVPSVLNLVFFKPVRSHIKYVQMIGRGTRLCEKLIDGKDKEYFLIFDYCGNFEFFDEHPELSNVSNGKSLSQRLFDLRLEIMCELQSYEHQKDQMHKAYYDRLKAKLYTAVAEIKSNSSKIAVRQKMAYVDKYIDYELWSAISPVDKKEIELYISGLIANEIEEDINSLRFDAKMLDIELAVLAGANMKTAARSIRIVRRISQILLQYSGSQSAVQANADALVSLSGEEFWVEPSVDKLEEYREAVRNLMKYLPSAGKPVIIDLEDEIIASDYEPEFLIDIRTYKEKVIDYLIEHEDNETVKKIKNIEPITAEDLKELERILWNELGSEDDYRKTTNIDNLAAFIRSIVGVDQRAINEKFGAFLNDNVMNSQQQEFVKAVIDYVRENGDIETSVLIESAPFDNYDILSLFGPNIQFLTEMIEKIHNCIVAA
ncbi:MAG: DEAD/DEAH box helicase family protein [Clostridiales bacterium]|nr:DEAD/DEAH box helicase family protein [Clostridiales bacterium]